MRHKNYADPRYCHHCGKYLPDVRIKGEVFCDTTCQDLYVPPEKPLNSQKLKTLREQNQKLMRVKAQKCICQGCLRDFSACPDFALIMCFEICHIHGKDCFNRSNPGLGSNDNFVACSHCNMNQRNRCGYYENKILKRVH